MSKFKKGDRVIVTTEKYDSPGYIQYLREGTVIKDRGSWLDVKYFKAPDYFGNSYKEDELELIVVYNSPLYQALK